MSEALLDLAFSSASGQLTASKHVRFANTDLNNLCKHMKFVEINMNVYESILILNQVASWSFKASA